MILGEIEDNGTQMNADLMDLKCHTSQHIGMGRR